MKRLYKYRLSIASMNKITWTCNKYFMPVQGKQEVIFTLDSSAFSFPLLLSFLLLPFAASSVDLTPPLLLSCMQKRDPINT